MKSLKFAERLTDMNLSYMKYVYAVYQEHGFSRAAQKLYVAQPWLSTAVRKVEQELHITIFDRSTTPISLTEAGRCYIEYAEKILKLQEEMETSLREYSAGSTNIRIGSSMFFCSYVLPHVLQEFRTQYPGTTFSFNEGSSTDMLQQLEEGKLDFVLESEKSESPSVCSTVWATERIILAVPAGDAVNRGLEEYRYTFEEFTEDDPDRPRKPAVPLQNFKDEPFLFLRQGNDIYQRGVDLCRAAGFSPKILLNLEQMLTAYHLVCEGAGVTFLRSTIPHYVIPSDRIVFYRIDGPQSRRDIYLSRRKRNSSLIQQQMIGYLSAHSLTPNF